ncbi:MAG: 3'-5' exonuclease, partial [Longimicrobiales bacterium]
SPECASAEDIARDDAERLASWILARVDAGERAPGDFLVLTTRKNPLAHYGRALEARGLPVQISGSAVGIEQELDELLRLLRTLADPADPVGVVATLVGPFFGLDHEQLAAHLMDGDHRRGFDFRWTTGRAETTVERALVELHELWRTATSLPADAALAAIVDRLGLLPYAAAGELGDSRAGALVYVLDAARAASLNGETSLPAALDAIEAALENEDAEAPLQPGRENVVRLMNLHKAKGLEAPVVVLAHPREIKPRAPNKHIERSDDARPRAYLTLEMHRGRASETLARPIDWPMYAEEESRYEAAEDDRLLYVAATRARDELVVARSPKTSANSAWAPLHAALDRLGTRLTLEPTPAPAPERLARDEREIAAEIERVATARQAAARPSYATAAITRLAAASGDPGTAAIVSVDALADDVEPFERPDLDALTWGTIVHRALEAVGRGPRTPRAVCRNVLVEAGAPIDPAGEPRDLDALTSLVDSVTRSRIWARARHADHRLVEVPFAEARSAGGLEIREGVIDLAFRGPDGWVIVDYKTDATRADAERRTRHRRQVELYAESWTRMTGEPVVERVIFYVRAGTVERWREATGTWSAESLSESGDPV